AEREREQALVASRRHDGANRAEPTAEQPHALRESAEVGTPMRVELWREQEPGRCLLRPALEELFARQALPGGVQLDRREAPGVVAQEVRWPHVGGVEARLPGRVGPAGSADIEPR